MPIHSMSRDLSKVPFTLNGFSFQNTLTTFPPHLRLWYLTFSVLQLKTYILNREAWDLKTMNTYLGGKSAKGKKIHSSLNCSSELISLVITEGGNMKTGEAGLRLDVQGLTTGMLPLVDFLLHSRACFEII